MPVYRGPIVANYKISQKSKEFIFLLFRQSVNNRQEISNEHSTRNNEHIEVYIAVVMCMWY